MSATTERVLGIDLGTSSVGWALIEQTSGKPSAIVAAGVRVFEAGVEGSIERGRDESRSLARREARLRRRQLWRRSSRKRQVFQLLQLNGLLPAGDRVSVITSVDQELLAPFSGLGLDSHTFLYSLRALALDQRLEITHLGRILYHLSQRRGFLSNRKSAPKNEESAKLLKEISALRGAMRETGARTLGEYFAIKGLADGRIRSRWTARAMFEEEFELIWAKQSSFHSEILTDELYKRLRKALFRQRPLRSQKRLIGECELERRAKRSPWADPLAQTFRLLQKVNILELHNLDTGEVRILDPSERESLISTLETAGDLTWPKVRELLGLSKSWNFNLERENDKRLIGNRTIAKVRAVAPELWDGMTVADRDRLVEDLLSIQKPETLAKRCRETWGLSGEQAEQLANIRLDQGYCALSRKALRRIVPLLREGHSYPKARKLAYPEADSIGTPMGSLPPLSSAPLANLRTLRNPVVTRSLSELRKIVNAVVATYGKPDLVRIELARDMKRSRLQRKKSFDTARRNERAREEARSRLLKEAGIESPSRRDIEKVLLADECGWTCPYTGKCISWNALVGSEPQFDVEHIIPFSISLDNTFANKTLCYHEENRNVKRNRTPYQAYAADASRYKEILSRVAKFKERTGSIGAGKLQKFAMKKDEVDRTYADFSRRHLQDTAYGSRLAMDYVALLYGGRFDASRKLRVQAVKGGTTGFLRSAYELSEILNDGGIKTRDDHRHHAVDAIAVALTTPSTLKALSVMAQQQWLPGEFRLPKLVEPWAGFLPDARQVVQNIITSHRSRRKVSGRLHEDTNYSKPLILTDSQGKQREVVHVRKKVTDLSRNQVEKIVDHAVRAAVQRKLAEVGGNTEKLDEANPPVIRAKDGREIPIKSVRICEKLPIVAIGSGVRKRFVNTASNHHVAIFESIGPDGRPCWEGQVVSRLSAYDRMRRKAPVVDRAHSNGGKFLFSLSSGDTVIFTDKDGIERVCIVTTFWPTNTSVQVSLAGVNDARPVSEIKKNGALFSPSVSTFPGLSFRKIQISPLGSISSAHD